MSTQRLPFGDIFPDLHGFILFPIPRCIGRVFKAPCFNSKHAPLNQGIHVISGAAKDSCRPPVPLMTQEVPFSDSGREGQGSPQPEHHRTGVTMTTDISTAAERNGKGMNCDARSATREASPRGRSEGWLRQLRGFDQSLQPCGPRFSTRPPRSLPRCLWPKHPVCSQWDSPGRDTEPAQPGS